MENLPLHCVQTRSSIWRMYRDAADHDYLVARFCAHSNLLYQFWWNAQQAVEKYLKATLLLNGLPVHKYGHQLSEMLTKARTLAGDLLPLVHCPPRCFVPYWPVTSSRGFMLVDNFVARIETSGDPNNRYRVFSTFTRNSDLYMFDELCFELRRIAFPLDIFVTDLNASARDLLLQDRKLQLHKKMGFEGIVEKQSEEVWRDHFEWCNFAYFYDLALERGEYPRWGGAHNAEPYIAINQASEESLRSIEWIAENGFPRRLAREVKEEIERNRLRQME